jgi:putative tricarboxylic transport membrane protein
MRNRTRRVARAAIFLVCLPLAATHGMAEAEFPSRPIEFIVPWGPGGGADQLARKLAKLMEPRLKVSLPVINVPGATGQTGVTKLLTAPADGYTMSVFTQPTFALQAGTPPPKWTMEQIEPLGIVLQQSSSLLVAEGGRFKTWADVEKAAKAGPLRVAITGFGSDDDLTVTFLAKRGLQFLSVPFPKAGERYAAILGGHSDVLYEQIGDVRNFVDGKQMRPVIFLSEKRDPGFPDVPTSFELGYKVAVPQFRSVIIRAGTDAGIVKTLVDALSDAVKDPEFAAFLKDQWADADSHVPHAASKAFLDELLKGTKQLVASLGIQPEGVK